MKIEDLIQLLTNRSREFKLSRDYAKMSGDLERMNAADKEVIALEDTLYQLSLLVDTTKSAAVKEEVLSEVLTDGSVSVLGEYDITVYATDPLHERKIMNILSKMGVMDTVDKIDTYIRGMTLSSPVTGDMVMSASLAYDVDTRLLMAMMQQDSSFGTAGIAVRTRNPGNVGNDDDGNIRTYDSWQEGVTAVAEWLNRHRGSTTIPEEPVETIPEVIDSALTEPEGSSATSTPSFVPPTATSPIVTTSTTTTITTMPAASSTPATAPSTGSGQATTTPVTAPLTDSTSSPQASSEQATTTPVTSTSTTSTTTTATTTPVTSAPVTAPSTDSTSSPQASSEEATTTPATSTSTTSTATTSAPQVSPLQVIATEEMAPSSTQATTTSAN